jgi:hypothetical protein
LAIEKGRLVPALSCVRDGGAQEATVQAVPFKDDDLSDAPPVINVQAQRKGACHTLRRGHGGVDEGRCIEQTGLLKRVFHVAVRRVVAGGTWWRLLSV